MKTCEYCNKPLLVKNPHIVSNHYRHCVAYQQKMLDVNKLLTKDFLQKEYVENGKSLHFLRIQLGLKRNRLIRQKLKEFGIRQFSQSEIQLLPHQRNRIIKTCNENFGADSPLHKDTSSRIKLEQNLLFNDGVTNVFQREDVKRKIKRTVKNKYGTKSASGDPTVRSRIQKTCTERYGVDNVWKNKDIIEKCKNTKSLNPKAYSPASDVSQKLFFAIYEKLPVELQQHTYFSSLNKEYGQNFDKKYYCYDFVITTVKKCIEFNGDYWHMNPMIFRANDVNTTINKTASEIWEIDKQKQNCLRSRGFEILTIWQQDYKRFPKTIIKKCIKFLIGNKNV